METGPETLDFLHQLEFFSGLSPEALSQVVSTAEQRSYLRGDMVFREDDDAKDLFVVRKGRIAIANRSPDGRESVLALMSPGDLFGDMALFDGQGRSAGARALEESLVISIPFEILREKFREDASSLWNVVAMLSRRIRAANDSIADSVFLDVTGRTAKRLLEIAGDRDEFTLPITQEELAGMVGASRERVNKAIAQFVRLGWIDQTDRVYKIVDRRKLTIRST